MFNFLAGNKWLSIILLAIALFLGAWLQISRAQNTALNTKLEQAEAESEQWAAVAASRQATIETMQSTTAACIDREAKALADLEARENIFNSAAVRLRTEQESREVIDDATRKAVVDRLNRPL